MISDTKDNSLSFQSHPQAIGIYFTPPIKTQAALTKAMREGQCIIKPKKAPTQCFHLKDSGRSGDFDGNVCHLWDRQPGSYPAQEWIYENYLIKSKAFPNKCLHLIDATGGAYNGNLIHLWSIIPGGNYRPQMRKLTGTSIVSMVNTSFKIHLDNGSASNGTKLVLWEGNSESLNHEFEVEWLENVQDLDADLVPVPSGNATDLGDGWLLL